mmetsp:Transcript_8775/g.21632  ORF Transcript_8775/g.21632 Transcript_8775/m.21632 type:complete len:88 (-) Transcript_8775:73-336(-)
MARRMALSSAEVGTMAVAGKEEIPRPPVLISCLKLPSFVQFRGARCEWLYRSAFSTENSWGFAFSFTVDIVVCPDILLWPKTSYCFV